MGRWIQADRQWRASGGALRDEGPQVPPGPSWFGITMRDVSKSAKRRIGRLAYFRSGMSALRRRPVQMKIHVNGKAWFSGKAAITVCIPGSLTAARRAPRKRRSPPTTPTS